MEEKLRWKTAAFGCCRAKSQTLWAELSESTARLAGCVNKGADFFFFLSLAVSLSSAYLTKRWKLLLTGHWVTAVLLCPLDSEGGQGLSIPKWSLTHSPPKRSSFL